MFWFVTQILYSYEFLPEGNWECIRGVICSSNVIQRDSRLFARKLDKLLLEMAKEEEKEVGIGDQGHSVC